MTSTNDRNTDRLRRWRLILGGGQADGICGGDSDPIKDLLQKDDLAMDKALAALYGSDRSDKNRGGGLGQSAPNVARWLGDIRDYFPSSVVRVMQQDALERLHLRQMLLEPEMLEAVEADVHLVANLMSLNGVIPEGTKATARLVVRKVVDELLRQLQNPMQQAVMGSLNRSQRNNRPAITKSTGIAPSAPTSATINPITKPSSQNGLLATDASDRP